MSEHSDCHFCEIPKERIVDESDTCLVIRDIYPVTALHTLIITKRHVPSYFDLTDQERREIERHLDTQKKQIETEDNSVTGFNVGINCGEDAGQTVMHCHVHLIPRRKGDIDNPRGGVRGVIPDKQSY
jgi:ATP adenylyltransferase